MFAAEYFGTFMDDKIDLRAAIRAPYFKRDLNQFCFSQNGLVERALHHPVRWARPWRTAT